MSTFSFTPRTNWQCAACGEPLTPTTVGVEYMGNTFSVELPACARCGLVLVPEELALGKMLEVEQLLEDK
ncbi:MAG: DVU_1557 family redox protein [Desulfovibrionaceae bacterium]